MCYWTGYATLLRQEEKEYAVCRRRDMLTVTDYSTGSDRTHEQPGVAPLAEQAVAA